MPMFAWLNHIPCWELGGDVQPKICYKWVAMILSLVLGSIFGIQKKCCMVNPMAFRLFFHWKSDELNSDTIKFSWILLFTAINHYNIAIFRVSVPIFSHGNSRNLQPATVELEIMQQARMTLARSPPGTTSELTFSHEVTRFPWGKTSWFIHVSRKKVEVNWRKCGI